MCVSDEIKKATLSGNQRRPVLRHERIELAANKGDSSLQACVSSTKLTITDFIARYQYNSDQ
jgi:hypothetical protein